MRVKIKVKVVLTILIDDLEVEDPSKLHLWIKDNLDPVVTDRSSVNYSQVGEPEFYVTSFSMKDTNNEEQSLRSSEILPPGG